MRSPGAVEAPSKLRSALRKFNGHLQKADFSGIQAKGLNLRSLDLTGAKFDKAVIDNWWFHGFRNDPACKLDGASFRGATFINTNMKKSSLVKADFSGAKLVSTKDYEVALNLEETNVAGADFSNITFSGGPRGKALRLSKADARGADFTDSNLPNTDMQGADIRGADFSDSILRGVVMRKTDMRDSKFRNTDLTEMQLPRAVKLDMQIQWGNSDTNRSDEVDFSGAKLNGVDLKFRHLKFCNFEGATFINTDMEGAVLIGSNFKKANLTGANL
ncbi:MAG: pentapeptide repeat-containing protein [Verrucomicrobia bacterium]|nr:pentapeptide repeat-containing protein [Verrucomicrobiota bacterium]